METSKNNSKDAHNAFNEEKSAAMMWAVRHKWPSGARFAFNCYQQWATLVIREGDGTGNLLHIKEGVNQGDPQDMIAYGLGILPLIRYLRTAHPGVTKSWYDDDSGAGGTLSGIRRHLGYPMVIGPLRGYLPETTKRILVVSPQSIPWAEALFWGYGLKVMTGSQYLGGFMGTEAAHDQWLKKIEGW